MSNDSFQRNCWSKNPAIQFNKKLNWPHLTKSGSLRCCLPLMTNFLHKKLRYQLILSQDIDNQTIMQSDCMKGKPGNIRPNYYFFRCCLCLKNSSVINNQDINWWYWWLKILQSVWLKAFFPGMCFLEDHEEIFYGQFLGKKKKHEWINFLANVKNPVFGKILGIFPKTRIFEKTKINWLYQFLTLKIL